MNIIIPYTRYLGKIGRKNGGSYHVTLPIEEIRHLKWRPRQMLIVERHDDEIRIRKADFRPKHIRDKD